MVVVDPGKRKLVWLALFFLDTRWLKKINRLAIMHDLTAHYSQSMSCKPQKIVDQLYIVAIDPEERNLGSYVFLGP